MSLGAGRRPVLPFAGLHPRRRPSEASGLPAQASGGWRLFGTREPFPYELRGFQYARFQHDSPIELEVWFWSTVAVATLGLAGFVTRLSTTLIYLSLFLFRERGPYATFGADLVMNCLGVWLVFLDSGRMWSVDALVRRARGKEVAGDGLVELWPARAIQIQVALIYLVTGLAKLQTTPWQDGSAVYYALHVGNVVKGQSPSWVLEHHVLLSLMTYGTLLIELSVPFMLFYRPLRNWAFLMCFLMHTGIDLLMSIRFFSLAMYVGFLSFLDGSDWDRRMAALRRVAGRWPRNQLAFPMKEQRVSRSAIAKE